MKVGSDFSEIDLTISHILAPKLLTIRGILTDIVHKDAMDRIAYHIEL